MSRQPNVLFLLSDQHNAKCMGVAGHDIVKTPNLDELAADGVCFDCAITQSPICTPSRVSMLSGQYVHNHGLYGIGGVAAAVRLPTIFGHFRAGGYRTAAIGKIHCPFGWVDADCDLFLGQEFDDYPPPREFSAYDLYLKDKGLLSKRDDLCYPEQQHKDRQSKDGRCSALNYNDSVEGWCADQAKRFIEDNSQSPWFMQVSFPRPHQIYAPAAQFWQMYDENLPMPPNADIDLSLKPPHLRKTRQSQEEGQDEMLFGEKTYRALRQRKLRGYYGLVSQTDHAIGEILQFLRDQQLENDTIVVYTSDHGEYACEFGLLEKAPGICSDAVTRVPQIWRWPGQIKSGYRSSRIVESIDIATTCASLASMDGFDGSDGKNISPLLRGEDIELHRIGVTEHPWSKSIRKGAWRLVHYPLAMFADESPGVQVGELYNLHEDAWEMNNLFYQGDYQGVIDELRNELLDWMVTTCRISSAIPTLPAEHLAHDGRISADAVRDLLHGQGTRNYL